MDTFDLNHYLISRPAATFFMRITSDSMKDEGILQSDFVVVDRSLSPKAKDLVIAVIDGELMLQRFQSEHEIWGVVTGVVRKI